MGKFLTLEQMIELYGRETFPVSEERIRSHLECDSGNDRALGHLLQACNLYAEKQYAAARAYLRQARRDRDLLSEALIAMIVWLSRRMGEPQAAAYDCLNYAQDAVKAGQYDLAAEACSGAVFLDQAGQFELTRHPEQTVQITRLYEQIAQTMSRSMVRRKRLTTGRLRVAMLTGNLVDDVVAYSRRILQFARYADHNAFEIRVYSTENLTARQNPLFPFGLENGSSSETAPKLLKHLQQLGVPVWLAPRDRSVRETAAIVMERLAADGVDIAMFQTGIASPVDWLVARWSDVAVKAGIHIGSSPFNCGFDCYYFDNPANIEREQAYWDESMGEQIVLSGGVDIEALRNSPILSRLEIGIPQDAVLLGSISNHLGARMSEAYCGVLIRLMQRFPQVYYLGVGVPPGEGVLNWFRDGGVADRVRFPGPVSLTGAVLKMLDIYVNEFPVGGSESVKEAIACGVPVAAIRWSNAHAECAGAEIVGPKWAVASADPAAYEALLAEWITNDDERHNAGYELARRAEEHYSFSRYSAELLNQLKQRWLLTDRQ